MKGMPGLGGADDRGLLGARIGKYSAFRFKLSALNIDFPRYVSQNRSEYLLLGRTI